MLLVNFLPLCFFSFASCSCTSLLDGYPVLFSGFVYTPASSLSSGRALRLKALGRLRDGVPLGRSRHIKEPVMHLIANGDHCSHFCLQELCTLCRYPLLHDSRSQTPCRLKQHTKTVQSTPRPAYSPPPTSLLAPSDPPNFFYPALSHPSTKISAAVLPANPPNSSPL